MTGKLQKIQARGAGIDVGSRQFFVGIEDEEVKSFGTFTSGCYQVVEYLQQHSITSVAMEATGVYWITLHDMLTVAGIEVAVVNGRHVKHVPGRKTDVKDCMWISELHSYGLLKKSFIPDAEVKEMRHYMRLRENHIEQKVKAVQRMDKALTMMNIRLSSVVSDLQGKSSFRIIEAILKGERNTEVLLTLCDNSILKHKQTQMQECLNGFYKPEQLFALKQSWEQYQFSEKLLQDCDGCIEKLLQKLTVNKPEPPVVNQKPKRIYHNKPQVENLHKMVQQLYDGKDLTVLPGITSYSLLKFFSVTGSDLKSWGTEKHFTAWLGLAPNQYQSGKMKKYRRIKMNTEAGQILKECVQPLLRSKHVALGIFGKRISARRGPSVAIKAMARKLACWIYRMVNNGLDFVANGIKQYEERQKKDTLKWLEKKAKDLNLVLIPR